MKYTLFLALTLSTIWRLNAQTASEAEAARQRLLSDLVVIYVEKPHLADGPTVSFVLNNQEIAANTLNGSFWSNTENDPAKEVVKSFFQTQTSQNGKLFQYLAASILKIQDKRVKIFIFNDRNNAALTAAGAFHETWNITLGAAHELLPTASAGIYSWPTGVIDIQGEFTGFMRLSTKFLADYNQGREAAKAVFIHELVHTQDNSAFVVAPFGSTYRYGRDDGHFFEELIPNYNATYGEAVANAFQLRYFRFRDMYNWLNNNNQLGYEVISSCSFGQNACLDDYMSTTYHIAPAGTDANNIAWYNIRDIPSDVAVHNEMVQAYIMFAYMRYFSVMALVDDIKRSIPSTNGAYGFPIIFREMVKTANQFHNSRSAGGRTHGQYLPIAMLDFYTGFKLSDKAMLDRCLRTPLSATWTVNIDDYWTNHRPRMLQILRDNRNQYSIAMLRQIAVHFNVVSAN